MSRGFSIAKSLLVVTLCLGCGGNSRGPASTSKLTPEERRAEEREKARREIDEELKRLRGPTMDKYKRLSEGMSYEDVCAVVESDGMEVSINTAGEITTVVHTWKSGESINVTFQNDRLVSKSQSGLK